MSLAQAQSHNSAIGHTFNLNWVPPAHVNTITAIDTHTSGEPLRVILSGLPPIMGRTVLEKRRTFMKDFDYLRTGLLWEPRGHKDMYGAVLSLSAGEADLDVFFINTAGYSPMCGHAILAIAAIAFSTDILGRYDLSQELVLHTPAGLNYARVAVGEDGVVQAFFKNVPSFVYLMDEKVKVPQLGTVRFDVAFGGAFYAIVDSASLNLNLDAADAKSLVEQAQLIKKSILDAFKIEHPFEAELNSLFGVIFTGKAHDGRHHSRNVNVFEDSGVDRSPTGTGLSARCALHLARGEIKMNEIMTVESIIGSTMTVRGIGKTIVGMYEAIIPEIGGTAHITGRHEFYFDPADPYKKGFTLG